MADIVERLRSSEPLPFCPYDSRSPEYWTAPNDEPCKVCGGLNDSSAPDLCRGADTRIMKDAADEIDRLRKLAKELSNALLKIRPLGGSEMFLERCGDFYADPEYCGRLIDELRAKMFEDIKDRYKKAASSSLSSKD